MPSGICRCGCTFRLSRHLKLTNLPYVHEYCSASCVESHIKEYIWRHTYPPEKRYLHNIDRVWPAVDPNTLGIEPGDVWSDRHGVSFRSAFELIVADWLIRKAIFWRYEPVAFQFGESSYTPDFLTTNNVFIEVKGKWGFGAKSKVKRFMSTFPELSFIVIPWYLQDALRKDV